MIEIVLPSRQAPTFPAECVACGAANPRHQARLFAHDTAHQNGREVWPSVPCCWPCAMRVHSVRISRSVLFVVGFGAVVTLFLALMGAVSPAAAGRATIVLLGDIIFAVILARRGPPPFDMRFYDEKITYRFSVDAVGYAFRNANPPSPEPQRHPVFELPPPELHPHSGEKLDLRSSHGPETVTIRDSETGQAIGRVSDAECEFLRSEFGDVQSGHAYYVSVETVQMLARDGAPDRLLRLLRGRLGAGQGVEIRLDGVKAPQSNER